MVVDDGDFKRIAMGCLVSTSHAQQFNNLHLNEVRFRQHDDNYSFSVCVSSLMLLDNVLITIFRNTVPSSGAKQVVMPEISENI